MAVTKTRSAGGSGQSLAQIIENIRQLNGLEIRVGSTGPAASAPFIDRKTGDEVGTVAGMLAVHEFGWGPPERPILRITLDANRQTFRPAAEAIGRAALHGRARILNAAMGIGEGQSRSLRDMFFQNQLRPLAQATKDDPGRDSRHIPLVDTEQILGSISFRVSL